MKSIVRTCIIFFLAVAAASMAIMGAVVWFALQDLPKLDALKDYHPPQSTVVYDRNKIAIGRLFDERRTVVALDKLPRYVPLAFVAAEDGDFFEHRGIDYFGLLRAVALEIKFRTVGGRRVGGSTITQQTARAMLLSSSQTYVRKIKEIVLAKRIEDALSKEQILSLYLNQIYFGNGAYGIEEAALTYFDKPARELNLAESAVLASIPKSPNRINPLGDLTRLKQRQAYVLEHMVKHKFIDEKAALKAKQTELISPSHKNYASLAPYFLSAVKNDLTQELGEEVVNKGGIKVYSTLDLSMQKAAQEALEEGLRNFDKHTGFRGPLVRPTPEQHKILQAKLEEYKKISFADKQNNIWDLSNLSSEQINKNIDSALRNIKIFKPKNNLIIAAKIISINNKANYALVDLGRESAKLSSQGFSWTKATKISNILKPGDIILVKLHDVDKSLWLSLEQEPLVNGGLVALDVESGDVLAMVGGYDFAKSPFNRIMQAKRQPGSGIKPLLYSLALDKKLVTSSTIITDAPKAFYDPGTEDFWRPRNSTNQFLGDVTFRRCLRSSINTCSITLLEKVGIPNFIHLAKQLNLSTEQTPYPHNLTIALGSAESFPINVANAMRIFPRLGLYNSYRMIDRFKLGTGQEVKREIGASEQVIAPGAAYITTNILQGVISEAQWQKNLDKVKTPLAGKTGTTNDARTVMFFGYSPRVLALVVVGYDDNRSLGSDAWGINTAFPTWARFMNNISQPDETLSFVVPDDIEWRYVDANTGKAQAFYNNLGDMTLIKEAFLLGTAPVEDEEELGPVASPVTNSQGIFAP